MSKLLMQLRTLTRSNRERRLRSRGYRPGAMSDNLRLWWNDNDDCIVEEINAEIEGGNISEAVCNC